MKKINNRILIAGDIMLDSYHFGKVERISPEAPVPVFLETSNNKQVPGGAANVAVNIAAIGIETALCSVIGQDENGEILINLLNKRGIKMSSLIRDKSRITTTKLRYIGPNNQQIMRVDTEETGEISDELVNSLFEKIEKQINEYGVILLSDYKKGFLSKKVAQKFIQLGKDNNIPVLIDVKERNIEKYVGATLLKPNRKELTELTGLKVENKNDAIMAAKWLCKEANVKYVLTTLGADGMVLVDKDGLIDDVKSTTKEVYDVTGAGDTSISYLAAELVKGTNIKEAVRIANYAAGVQVSKLGTSIVYPDEVAEAMRRAGAYEGYENEHFSSHDMIQTIVKRKEHGEKIVFTNGCFDILHKGHIDYLQKAKKLGDILVVGLNSDASVKRLKGEERPINCLADRADMLLALSVVDYVIPFEEDTPLELIKAIMPDVLVKGGDYTLDNIVGAKEVISNGGEVKVLSFVPGHSTTQIIKKIQNE